MKKLVVIPLTVLLGSCATVPPPTNYHATGSDPTWNLVINDQITFTSEDTAAVSEPTPPMIRGFARGQAELYQTRRIEVNIARDLCMPLTPAAPDRVKVTVDGHTYSGCGGGAAA